VSRAVPIGAVQRGYGTGGDIARVSRRLAALLRGLAQGNVLYVVWHRGSGTVCVSYCHRGSGTVCMSYCHRGSGTVSMSYCHSGSGTVWMS
jgi:hypothetical protein